MTSERIPYDIQSPDALKDVLLSAGLPVGTWGDGPTKTYEDLWKEIADGESELAHPSTQDELNQWGEVIRVTNVLGIDVYHQDENGRLFRLREEKQLFKDGRGERRRELMTSLGEKIKADEDKASAVIRAVQEELGISSVQGVEQGEQTEIWKSTPTYPELSSKLNIYKYSVLINPMDFRREGYVEDQDSKQTFFVWDEVLADSPSSNAHRL